MTQRLGVPDKLGVVSVLQIKSIVCGSDGEAWSLDKNGYSYRYDPEFDWVKVGDMSLHKLAVGSRQRVYGIGGVRNYVWK